MDFIPLLLNSYLSMRSDKQFLGNFQKVTSIQISDLYQHTEQYDAELNSTKKAKTLSKYELQMDA